MARASLLRADLTSYAMTEMTSHEMDSMTAVRSEKLLGGVVRRRLEREQGDGSAARPS
jgi:hypothetical protein